MARILIVQPQSFLQKKQTWTTFSDTITGYQS